MTAKAKRRYLVIREDETGEEVRRFDITDMSERRAEKLENGLTMRIDWDRFSLTEEER